MLEVLKIKNLAVIDSAEIKFTEGLNILSGETGAGKSIVLEAISLLLGGRASTEFIRTGCEEAVIEGLFDVSEMSWMRDRLVHRGFPSETSELLIRRVLHRGGRHRIHVNGELATLGILAELCEGLIDLCGQHEHQSLIKPRTQIELLDRYGGLGEQAERVANAFSHVRSLRAELEALRASEAERVRKSDYLQFQLEELKAAALTPGEDDLLREEKRLLQTTEQRLKLAEAAREMFDADQGVTALLQAAAGKLKALGEMDPVAQPWLEGVERAAAEVEEACLALSRYQQDLDLNPDRLQEVQDRLALIADLRRKYGATVEEMLATFARIESEFSSLGQVNERIEELNEFLVKSEADLYNDGHRLSDARRKVAKTLSDSVNGELKDLRMTDAQLKVALTMKEDISQWSTAFGADEIEFSIRTNKGEAERPLGKIASGGELSRLMLAIRRVIADKGGIGVYLFDEIDAGIGGQTAFEVGKKLKSVSKYNQVICITHLPQVASFADCHLTVQKRVEKNRTITEILELSTKSRQEEIARMLGGPKLTKSSLQNAAELIQSASV
ncbi:MAG: DNA repair protein RecN [Bacteriovoracia bacterium]